MKQNFYSKKSNRKFNIFQKIKIMNFLKIEKFLSSHLHKLQKA